MEFRLIAPPRTNPGKPLQPCLGDGRRRRPQVRSSCLCLVIHDLDDDYGTRLSRHAADNAWSIEFKEPSRFDLGGVDPWTNGLVREIVHSGRTQFQLCNHAIALWRQADLEHRAHFEHLEVADGHSRAHACLANRRADSTLKLDIAFSFSECRESNFSTGWSVGLPS